MRAFAMLVITTGCNAVFGIDKTEPLDPAPPDAAPQCPPLGNAPHFSGVIVQTVERNCVDYSISTTGSFALAACIDSSMIEGGEVDGPLSPIGIGNPLVYSWARLSPEGDEVFARDMSMAQETIARFRRSGDVWTRGADVFSTNQINGLSSPTRGSGNRRIAVLTDGSTNLLELEETPGTWTVHGAYVPSDLGGSSIGQPFLSEDGLRLVFLSIDAGPTRVVMYADRENRDQRFRPVAAMSGVPLSGGYMHMTPDCGRIYSKLVSAIVYTPQ